MYSLVKNATYKFNQNLLKASKSNDIIKAKKEWVIIDTEIKEKQDVSYMVTTRQI